MSIFNPTTFRIKLFGRLKRITQNTPFIAHTSLLWTIPLTNNLIKFKAKNSSYLVAHLLLWYLCPALIIFFLFNYSFPFTSAKIKYDFTYFNVLSITNLMFKPFKSLRFLRKFKKIGKFIETNWLCIKKIKLIKQEIINIVGTK